MENSRNEILEKAKDIINGSRQEQYGKAEDSFNKIAKFWSAYLNIDISKSQVADLMILLKIARNDNTKYKEDTYIDICGYAALGAELKEKEK